MERGGGGGGGEDTLVSTATASLPAIPWSWRPRQTRPEDMQHRQHNVGLQAPISIRYAWTRSRTHPTAGIELQDEKWSQNVPQNVPQNGLRLLRPLRGSVLQDLSRPIHLALCGNDVEVAPYLQLTRSLNDTMMATLAPTDIPSSTSGRLGYFCFTSRTFRSRLRASVGISRACPAAS